jgi:mersacidin/lichenicidin family type 2 lantibiotic
VDIRENTHKTLLKTIAKERICSMSLNYIIDAWRDEEYRESLDAETRSLLPANPAGELELSDAELADIDGGAISLTTLTTITWTWSMTTVSYTVTAMVEE